MSREKDTFEVGVVYRARGVFFLAVTDKTLITVKEDEIVEVNPWCRDRYKAARELDVEALCGKWRVPLSMIDKISKEYFTPANPRDSKPAGRRSRGGYESSYRSIEVYRVIR